MPYRIWKEFHEFALRGNFFDISIAIFVGAGMTPVATSLVKDVVMPVFGYALGRFDFADQFIILKQGIPAEPYKTLDAAQAAGAVTVNYGIFFNAVVSFFLITWVAFAAVKVINRWRRQTEKQRATPEETTKVCPFCFSVIPSKAVRCRSCTSKFISGTTNDSERPVN